MDLKPNDLVMLVWGCCPKFRSHIGIHGIYHGPSPREGKAECTSCGYKAPLKLATGRFNGRSGDFHVPYAWIIKIENPSDVDEDITETGIGDTR